MKDFEIHPIGTAKEILLSRKLMRVIDHNVKQYGKLFPEDVMDAYRALSHHYQKQTEMENQ